VALAIVLVALTVPALLINLYFTLLMLGRWPGLRHRLGVLFTSCGADTSSCALVVQTPYARLFGGAPNVFVGIVWNMALLGLGLSWMVSGREAAPDVNRQDCRTQGPDRSGRLPGRARRAIPDPDFGRAYFPET